MWEDQVWSCAPVAKNTENFCVPEVWTVNNNPDGAVIFVFTDCLTRAPLGPEYQDPVYNMPGVALDRGQLTTLQKGWVENTCDAQRLDTDDGDSWGFSIQGRGFADAILGPNGEALKSKLLACGTLVTWSFSWVAQHQFDWLAEGVMKASNVKGCCGDAIMSVGGVTRDKCV